MAMILPAAPMIGAPPGFNGQRVTIWRGLLYVPGDGDHGPRVRDARLDAIRVERDGRRLASAHGTRHVLVITGPARCAVSTAELLAARIPQASSREHASGPAVFSVVERDRLTRPGRNLEDIDRDFSVSRSPKIATLGQRCPHCGRFEPCPCDCR